MNCIAGGTLADGLLVPRVGTNAFELCHQYVDKVRLHMTRMVLFGAPFPSTLYFRYLRPVRGLGKTIGPRL